MAFKATDGTTFESRDEWRAYEFETNYTFRNRFDNIFLLEQHYFHLNTIH